MGICNLVDSYSRISAGRWLAALSAAGATLFLQPVCAQGASNLADALRGAAYSVFAADVNGDGQSDLLLKAKSKFAMIPLDDLTFPVPIPPSSPTFVLLSSGSAYELNSSPVSSLVNNAAWQRAPYELVYGDFMQVDGRWMLSSF